MTRTATGIPCLAIAALGLALIAADEPTQTIKARGITFDVPKSWASGKPANAMRLAQLKVEPSEGDKDAAELVLTAFPGGGGGVEANVARWKAQFVDSQGEPPEVTQETKKGKNVSVTFVETSGRYVAPVMPGRPEKNDKPNWRLLGAIVQAGDTGYFFKMVGPDKTMKAAKPGFEAMIKSIAVEK